MALLTQQLECLHCSHNRNFTYHTETAQRLVNQAELRELPRHAHLTCPRCGSTSLIRVWSDGIPYAAQGLVPRRRRARRPAANA
jgi:hypothetical protein